jgi:hypothetical protein
MFTVRYEINFKIKFRSILVIEVLSFHKSPASWKNYVLEFKTVVNFKPSSKQTDKVGLTLS